MNAPHPTLGRSEKRQSLLILKTKRFCFQNDSSKTTYGVQCLPGATFETPSTWPQCVDKLDCPIPEIDPTLMTYDWNSSASDPLTPPFSIEYEIIHLLYQVLPCIRIQGMSVFGQTRKLSRKVDLTPMMTVKLWTP